MAGLPLHGKKNGTSSAWTAFVSASVHAFQSIVDDILATGIEKPRAAGSAFHVALNIVLIEFLAPLVGIHGGWLNGAVVSWKNQLDSQGSIKKPLARYVFHPLYDQHQTTFGDGRDAFHVQLHEPSIDHVLHAGACISDGTWVSIQEQLAPFHYTAEIDTSPSDATTVTPSQLDGFVEAITIAAMNRSRSASGGTVFTSPWEAGLACKMALAPWLQAACQSIEPGTIDDMVFRPERAAWDALRDAQRKEVNQAINKVRMLDPACGSGVFLVEFARLIASLVDRLGSTVDKWKAVSRSIHGIDSNEWAVASARARLWIWHAKHGRDPSTTETLHVFLPDCTGCLVVGDFLAQDGIAGHHEFDIITGNPPYIRQEDIDRPWTATRAFTRGDGEGIRPYKDEIAAAISQMFPGVVLNRMSDYYVYFIYKATFFLCDKGTLCFITSNSWLTTRYGVSLQAFLVSRGCILSIVDFASRSFSHAEINTTMTSFMRDKRAESGRVPDRLAVTRFMQFKDVVPVSRTGETCTIELVTAHGSSVHRGIEVENLVQNVEDKMGVKTISIHHDDLRQIVQKSGIHVNDGRERVVVSGKWLGALLNAPSTFYDVMIKAKGTLVPLGALVKVLAGCYTGINAFFYVDKQTIENFNIEPEYLKPVIRSSKDINELTVQHDHAWTTRVLCIPPVPVTELERKGHHGIASYIKWGERQATSKGQKTIAGIPWPRVQTVKNRQCWYSIPPSNLLETRHFMQYISHDRFYCPCSVEPVVSDRCFHRLFPAPGVDGAALHAALNSTLMAFTVLVLGRTNLGAGALKIEALDAGTIPVLDVRALDEGQRSKLRSRLEKLERRAPRSLLDECGCRGMPARTGTSPSCEPLPDREDLDCLIFDALGVSNTTREAVYAATIDLVQRRLKKAKQFMKPGISSTLVG